MKVKLLSAAAMLGGGSLAAHAVVEEAASKPGSRGWAGLGGIGAGVLGGVGAYVTRGRPLVALTLLSAGATSAVDGWQALRTTGPKVTPDDSVPEGIAEAIEVMGTSQSGRPIANLLASGDIKFEVVSDGELQARVPGAGAYYSAGVIVVPQSLLSKPVEERVGLLAHEGQHALDDMEGKLDVSPVKAGVVGTFSGIMRMAKDPGNPVTRITDGISGAYNETEVRAYQRMADVDQELGLQRGDWIGSEEDGSTASKDDVRQELAHNDLYDPTYGHRASLDFKVAAGLTVGSTATLVYAGTKVPGMGAFARHPVKTFVGAGAVSGGLVAADLAADGWRRFSERQ